MPHRDTSQTTDKQPIPILINGNDPMLWMPHRDTILALQKAINRSQIRGDVSNCL